MDRLTRTPGKWTFDGAIATLSHNPARVAPGTPIHGWRSPPSEGWPDTAALLQTFQWEVSMKWFPRVMLGLAAFGLAAAISAQDLTGTLKKIKDTGAITIGYR